MISFADQGTKDIFARKDTKAARKALPSQLHGIAKRKLDQLAYAGAIGDLQWPPGNQLEKLRGNLAGFYSIRINEKWRIIFRWGDSHPSDIQIVDYH